MKLYKLTRQDFTTFKNTLWGENVTHEAMGEGTELCTKDVIHAYLSPELAVLFNPVHAGYDNPILWEAEGEVVVNDDNTKVGVKKLTTIKQIPLPEITVTQKVAFGILCALEVSKHKKFVNWANKWLSGEDRSKHSAYDAYAAHADTYGNVATAAHAYYSYYAARVASYTAHAAYANGVYAAYANAAASKKKLDLVSLVKKAMEY